MEYTQNIQKDDDVIGPVYLGGFCQGIRNSVKKVTHQQDVPCIADGREYQHPDGVLEHQGLGHQQVVGHQAAVEEHGKVNEQRQRGAALEVLHAHGIGHGAGEQHGQ